jgi:hypothetical protein
MELNRSIWTSAGIATNAAITLADLNGAPVGVWRRDGWYAISDEPPDGPDDDRLRAGWTVHAIVTPTEPSR